MYRLHLFLLLVFLTSGLSAQQLSLFTQYRENIGIINPAALNGQYFVSDHNLSFGLSYRSQWTELTTTPRTQTIHGEYFADEIGGSVGLIIGGHLINDQTGPTGFTGASLRLGGVVSGNPTYSGLAIGLTAGAVQYRVNTSEINFRDPNDVVGMNDQSSIFPDVGVGIYYYKYIETGFLRDDYIFGGVSVPQVIGLDLAFKDANGEFFTKRVQHFYAHVGMYKFLRGDSFLEPSAWVKYTPGAPINVDVNLRYQMESSLWIGTGLSTAGNMHVEAGFMLGNNVGFDNTLKLGYSFDYSFSSFGPSVGSTHELNVAFSLDR